MTIAELIEEYREADRLEVEATNALGKVTSKLLLALGGSGPVNHGGFVYSSDGWRVKVDFPARLELPSSDEMES
jgi:hypothetical protein